MVNIEYDFIDDELEDIDRCLRTLYGTQAGSVPLNRDFGIDYDGIVGLPFETATNMLALEVIAKTERYEPRVEVESVSATFDYKIGKMIPIIKITKREDDDE